MSGNSEKVVLKPPFPICPYCANNEWYKKYEAWEHVYLEQCDDEYYLTTGDELTYGDVVSPWYCASCARMAVTEVARILDEIQDNWAEWV